MIFLSSAIVPGAPVALLARVEDNTGALITASNVASIIAIVTNVMTATASPPIALNVASSVYNVLQLTDQWTADGIGFNVAARLDGSSFPLSGTIYQIIVTIVPTTGSAIPLAWQIQTDETF